MATTLLAVARTVKSVVYDSFAEAKTTVDVIGLQTSTTMITRDANTKEWTSVGLASQYHPKWIGWRVNAVDAGFTISGDITFNVRAFASVASAGRVHVKLFKRTVGGSDVDTLIASATAATNLTTSAAAYAMTVTPPAPVTLVHGERLLYRIYVLRQSADFDTATFSLRYNHATSGITNFVLTETATFVPDKATLILRRTAVNAIGNFFDMLIARGVTASTTGVVDTVASGTEIQWTRTAGGTSLEWISQRFTKPWVMLTDFVQFSGALTVHESNVAANCGYTIKLSKRSPNGTETIVVTASTTTEMNTTATFANIPNATIGAEVPFAEDDRLVFRVFIINIGTMGGSRTCTIGYDHTAATTGDSQISVWDTSEFKAEGDPGVLRIEGGMTMGGVGN